MSTQKSNGFRFNSILNIFPSRWENDDADAGNNETKIIPKFSFSTPDIGASKDIKVVIEMKDKPNMPKFQPQLCFSGKSNTLDMSTLIQPRDVSANRVVLEDRKTYINKSQFHTKQADVLVKGDTEHWYYVGNNRDLKLNNAGIVSTHDVKIEKQRGSANKVELFPSSLTNTNVGFSTSATGDVTLTAQESSTWNTDNGNVLLSVDSTKDPLVKLTSSLLELKRESGSITMNTNEEIYVCPEIDMSASTSQQMRLNGTGSTLISAGKSDLKTGSTEFSSSISGTTFEVAALLSASNKITITSDAVNSHQVAYDHSDSILHEATTTNVSKLDNQNKLAMTSQHATLEHGAEINLEHAQGPAVKFTSVPSELSMASTTMTTESDIMTLTASTQYTGKTPLYTLKSSDGTQECLEVNNTNSSFVKTDDILLQSAANKSLQLNDTSAEILHATLIEVKNGDNGIDATQQLRLSSTVGDGSTLKSGNDNTIHLANQNTTLVTKDYTATLTGSYGADVSTAINMRADKDKAEAHDHMQITSSEVKFPGKSQLEFWYRRDNTQEYLNDVLGGLRTSIDSIVNIMGGDTYLPNLRTSQTWIDSLSENSRSMMDLSKADTFSEGDSRLAYQIMQMYKNVSHLEDIRNSENIVSLNDILSELQHQTQYGSKTFSSVLGFTTTISDIRTDYDYLEKAISHLLNDSTEYLEQSIQDYTHREYVVYARDEAPVTVVTNDTTGSLKVAPFKTNASGLLEVDATHADAVHHGNILEAIETLHPEHMIPVFFKLDNDSDFLKEGYVKVKDASGVMVIDTLHIYETQYSGSAVLSTYNGSNHGDYIFQLKYYAMGSAYMSINASSLVAFRRNDEYFLLHVLFHNSADSIKNLYLITNERFELDLSVEVYKESRSSQQTSTTSGGSTTYTYTISENLFSLEDGDNTQFLVTAFHIDTLGRVYSSSEIPIEIQYNNASTQTSILSALGDAVLFSGVGTRTTTIKTLVDLNRDAVLHVHYGTGNAHEMDITFDDETSNLGSCTVTTNLLQTRGFSSSSELADGFTHVGKITFIPNPTASRFVLPLVHETAASSPTGTLIYVKYTKDSDPTNPINTNAYLLKGPFNAYELVDSSSPYAAKNLHETMHVELGGAFTSNPFVVLTDVSGSSASLSSTSLFNWGAINLNEEFTGHFLLEDGTTSDDFEFVKTSATGVSLKDGISFDDLSNPPNQKEFIVGSKDHVFVTAYDAVNGKLTVHTRYFDSLGVSDETLNSVSDKSMGIRPFGPSDEMYDKVCSVSSVEKVRGQEYILTVTGVDEEQISKLGLNATVSTIQGFMRMDVRIDDSDSPLFSPPLTMSSVYTLQTDGTLEESDGAQLRKLVGVPGVHTQTTKVISMQLTNRKYVSASDGNFSNMKLLDASDDSILIEETGGFSSRNDGFGYTSAKTILDFFAQSTGSETNGSLQNPLINIYFKSRADDYLHRFGYLPTGYKLQFVFSSQTEDGTEIEDVVTSGHVHSG